MFMIIWNVKIRSIYWKSSFYTFASRVRATYPTRILFLLVFKDLFVRFTSISSLNYSQLIFFAINYPFLDYVPYFYSHPSPLIAALTNHSQLIDHLTVFWNLPPSLPNFSSIPFTPYPIFSPPAVPSHTPIFVLYAKSSSD